MTLDIFLEFARGVLQVMWSWCWIGSLRLVYAEPYQPHSVPPNWGARCHRGPNVQSRYHLAPQRKLRSPKLKYEALEISEVRGPFDRKVLMHDSYLGPIW